MTIETRALIARTDVVDRDNMRILREAIKPCRVPVLLDFNPGAVLGDADVLAPDSRGYVYAVLRLSKPMPIGTPFWPALGFGTNDHGVDHDGVKTISDATVVTIGLSTSPNADSEVQPLRTP